MTIQNNTTTETMTDQQRDNARDAFEDIINHATDSIEGYEQAAEMVKNDEPELAAYFRDCAQKRQASRNTLINKLAHIDQHAVRQEFTGTTSGAIHQAFVSFRSLFQNDAKSALAEIERGESLFADRVEEALKQDLPVTASAALQELHDELSRREEMAEDLRRAS